jgi:hypothetical protein
MLNPAFVPVLAVVSIHCIFRLYQYCIERRKRHLRERVTYMLWMAAHQCN